MKVLFVGDIHNHQYMFNDIARLDTEYHFDKIILFGDYVDDWNTNNHDSLKTLEMIFNLKQDESDKYILLLGNHELSYLGYICSGHCFELDNVVNQKLLDNWDKLNLYYEVKLNDRIYICSHAGITKTYLELELKPLEKDYRVALDIIHKEKILWYLKLCSRMRGGDSLYSSLLWADKQEHYNLLDFNEVTNENKHQIIGHSPVKQITNYKDDDNSGNLKYDYWFIDTHSTYSDGTPYGNKSYLMWNENKFEILY